jgi:hypothetical protein
LVPPTPKRDGREGQKEVLVAKRVESFAYFLTHLDLTLEMRTAMDKT